MNAQTQKKGPGIFTTDLVTLEHGPVKIQGEIPLEWLASELTTCEYRTEPKSATIAISLDKLDEGVMASGSVQASIMTECGTCLNPIILDLSATVSTYLMNRSNTNSQYGDDDLTPEDLQREWFEGPTIILDDLIRDVIMLELPMNPRCSGECKNIPGLAKQVSIKKVDPRLAPLADINLSKEK